MEINDAENGMIFNNLLFLQAEVPSPNYMKKKFDILVSRLNSYGIHHQNKVISKAIKNDSFKKTVTMNLYLCLQDKEAMQQINEFISNYPEYKIVDNLVLKKGKYISISGNMNEFKKAIEFLISDSIPAGSEPMSIQEYMKNNRIIEIAKVAYDGHILGFDLFLED